LAWLVHSAPNFSVRETQRFEPKANAALRDRCERMWAEIERA